MNKEVGEVFIANDQIEVNLEELLKEAFSSIKMHTRVKVLDYKLNDGKVSLRIEGAEENIRVLEDRLGINKETTALTNSAVDRVKVSLSKLIERNFDESYSIKLKSLDNFSEEMIHIALELTLATIPYPVSVQYHIADDGYLTVSYSCFGNADKDERWSASSITAEKLIEKLKEISDYYENGAIGILLEELEG